MQDGFDIREAVLVQNALVPIRSGHDERERAGARDSRRIEPGGIEERETDRGAAGNRMVDRVRAEIDVSQDRTFEPIAR